MPAVAGDSSGEGILSSGRQPQRPDGTAVAFDGLQRGRKAPERRRGRLCQVFPPPVFPCLAVQLHLW